MTCPKLFNDKIKYERVGEMLLSWMLVFQITTLVCECVHFLIYNNILIALHPIAHMDHYTFMIAVRKKVSFTN